MHLHVWICYMKLYAHTYEDQKVASGFILQVLSIFFFWYMVSHFPASYQEGDTGGPVSPKDVVPQLAQCWDWNYRLTLQGFSGNEPQVLVFTWQSLYHLIHLPSPLSSILMFIYIFLIYIYVSIKEVLYKLSHFSEVPRYYKIIKIR